MGLEPESIQRLEAVEKGCLGEEGRGGRIVA
jgi:hypothetical protein